MKQTADGTLGSDHSYAGRRAISDAVLNQFLLCDDGHGLGGVGPTSEAGCVSR